MIEPQTTPDISHRFTPRRKAAILHALDAGDLSPSEALTMYALSAEEAQLWRDAVVRDGIHGLKAGSIRGWRVK